MQCSELGQKGARLPLSSDSPWLYILDQAIPFDGPPAGELHRSSPFTASQSLADVCMRMLYKMRYT